MNIVFRTDASLVIGMGHVMRCLALAKALRDQGAKVSFICREHDGHLCDLIASQGFEVVCLPLTNKRQADSALSQFAWLGVTWQEDAEQTREVLKSWGVKSDWLVIDHYQFDNHWESSLRSLVGRIMVIDDLADRAHDCDLLLDQNLIAKLDTRYAGKVSAKCILLLGPKYALLQSDYADLHDQIPPRVGPIQRILIFFSGADTENLTGKTLSAFLSLNKLEIQVDVVVTNSNPFSNCIRQLAAGYDNIRLYSSLPTLAPLMAKADLAIGAGGATSWERLCLGLPALIVTLADNQRPIADELNLRGLIRLLGHKDTLTEPAIAESLGKLLQQKLDEEWSLNCSLTVDGQGSYRVASVMCATENALFRARKATLSDENLLLEWANDPITRRNAFVPESILEEIHRAWFFSRLRNLDGCRLYIVEIENGSMPIGQVRFERQGSVWEVHYALSPIFRGRGLGQSLFDTALSQFISNYPDVLIFGQVKVENIPSKKIFESLGFDVKSQSEDGVIVFQKEFGL